MSVFVVDTSVSPAVVVLVTSDLDEAVRIGGNYVRGRSLSGLDVADHVHVLEHNQMATEYVQNELREERKLNERRAREATDAANAEATKAEAEKLRERLREIEG